MRGGLWGWTSVQLKSSAWLRWRRKRDKQQLQWSVRPWSEHVWEYGNIGVADMRRRRIQLIYGSRGKQGAFREPPNFTRLMAAFVFINIFFLAFNTSRVHSIIIQWNVIHQTTIAPNPAACLLPTSLPSHAHHFTGRQILQTSFNNKLQQHPPAAVLSTLWRFFDYCHTHESFSDNWTAEQPIAHHQAISQWILTKWLANVPINLLSRAQ